ncbi:hypothetical protein [Pyruvatibacter sp.]
MEPIKNLTISRPVTTFEEVELHDNYGEGLRYAVCWNPHGYAGLYLDGLFGCVRDAQKHRSHRSGHGSVFVIINIETGEEVTS